jgi:tRNA G10  N-methylase Trm11
MANALGIDVSEAVFRKLEKNEEKYPVEKYFGRAR